MTAGDGSKVTGKWVAEIPGGAGVAEEEGQEPPHSLLSCQIITAPSTRGTALTKKVTGSRKGNGRNCLNRLCFQFPWETSQCHWALNHRSPCTGRWRQLGNFRPCPKGVAETTLLTGRQKWSGERSNVLDPSLNLDELRAGEEKSVHKEELHFSWRCLRGGRGSLETYGKNS